MNCRFSGSISDILGLIMLKDVGNMSVGNAWESIFYSESLDIYMPILMFVLLRKKLSV